MRLAEDDSVFLRAPVPSRVRLLVHLSGEHPDLPEAELRGVLEADGFVWDEEARHGRLVIGTVRTHGRAAPVPGEVARTVARLAMTFEVARHRITAGCEATALTVAAQNAPDDILGDGETFAVRAERALPAAADDRGPSRADVEGTLGGVWSRRRRVDLHRPDTVVRAWLTEDQVLVGDLLWQNDRGAYEARATKARPFFSPISGHPRWMRAIVNLAAASPPDVVYDPLCGTGGILLEAALAGHHPIGSDIDPRMVEGSEANLQHAGFDTVTLFEGNIKDAPALFRRHTGLAAPGCIVTDLPYGQSASTGKEGAAQVAAWTFEAIRELLPLNHRAVVGVGDETLLEDLPSGLVEEARYALRVHKSLTRTYVVLRAVP